MLFRSKVAKQLLQERVKPHVRWQRVCLQPLLNFDFFSHIYRRQRPDFATWHSNHAAHFMHHYWRAWDDSGFSVKSSADERARYGEAVPEGYRLCDELLGRFLKLVDRDTVLVVASSMGQQPYVNERYLEGKIVVRFKHIDPIVDLLGREGIEETVATMVPQWNLRIPNPTRRAEVKARIEAAYRLVNGQREVAMTVQENEALLTVTPLGLASQAQGIRYFFPACPNAHADGHAIDELFAVDAPTVKQGMHHPDGVLAFIGADIHAGLKLRPCTNLDVAPSVLHLLGLPVPANMPGRALSEAWGGGASPGPGMGKLVGPAPDLSLQRSAG